jgi:hypothetical protein
MFMDKFANPELNNSAIHCIFFVFLQTSDYTMYPSNSFILIGIANADKFLKEDKKLTISL